MHTENSVKVETVLDTTVEKMDQANGAYRQPEVHELGKLEQVQAGIVGPHVDFFTGRGTRPC